MKKTSFILIAILLFDAILVYVFDRFNQVSFVLFRYINMVLILSIFIIGLVNIIITLKKKGENNKDTIARLLFSLLLCINISIFCFAPSAIRYDAALISFIILGSIMLLFVLITFFKERKKAIK